MDTHYNPNRKVYESDFLNAIEQRNYLEKQRSYTTSELIYHLKAVHNTINNILFRKTDKDTNEERRSYTLRQRYEALQDTATILKERNELPNEFEPFVLSIDELPWNCYGTTNPTPCPSGSDEIEP